MPLLVPSATGLANSGKGQIDRVHVGGPLDQGEIGRGHAPLPHHGLRQPLVQGQRKDQRVGKRVGDVVDVEDRRHLGLAGQSVEPFGDVEHQVPAVALGQPLDQPPGVADPVGLVAQFLQGPFDALDGHGAIEFGGLFLGVSFGQVVVAEVVS